MGRAKNTINPAEVSSTPIKVIYSVNYPSSSLGNYGITTSSGVNLAYAPVLSTSQMTQITNYRVIRQLYYQYYLSGSSQNSASFWDPAWQSTAASGTFDATNYYFPSESNAQITVFAIPSSQFGEQISRKSFRIASASNAVSFNLVDDGNGNIVDTAASNVHVGNLFYAQGIAVITNQNYV